MAPVDRDMKFVMHVDLLQEDHKIGMDNKNPFHKENRMMHRKSSVTSSEG